MNLGDYIGDTRTESLPPGFLKSIKIKYRQEASHVFPRGATSLRELSGKRVERYGNVAKEDRLDSQEEKLEEGTTSEDKVLPGFMSWKVPSRLLNQIQEKEQVTCDENLEGTSEDLESPRNGTSYSRELTSANVRPLKSSASTDSHHSELNVERHTSGVPKSNSSEDSSGKRQLKVRESNGALRLTKLQRRRTSEIDESRGVPKSSNPQQSEKSEIKVGEYRKSEMAKEDVQESARVQTTKHSDEGDNKLVKLSVRVLNPSSLNQKDDQKDNRSDRNVTTTRSARSEHNVKELPKMDVSFPKCNEKSSTVEEKNDLLPHLKRTKDKTYISSEQTRTKLPPTPERMEKINMWVKKSTHKERQAAFSLLSTFITSEKVKSSKLKHDRIRIALKALERKQTPVLVKPFRTNDKIHNLHVVSLDKHLCKDIDRTNTSRPTNEQMLEFKTWHHLPIYPYSNAANDSAVFVQPRKTYHHHFSIHPEWGLHTQVNMAKCGLNVAVMEQTKKRNILNSVCAW